MNSVQTIYPDGKTRSFLMPSSFDELSEHQYVEAIGLMNKAEKQPSAQWALLMSMLKMNTHELGQLNEAQRVQLLMKLEFLYDMSQLPHKCMIKKVSATGPKNLLTSLYGPGDVFKHLTFTEFTMAESKLEAYQRSKKDSDLNSFCGVLYRPADPTRKNQADRRTKYQEGLVDFYARFFQTVDKDIKSAIVMNYHGAKRFLPKIFPHVFPAPVESDEPVKEVQKNKISVSRSWLNTLISLADRDVTKIEQIENTPVHKVLFTLNELVQHNQKMKQEMDRLKASK